MRGNAAGSLEGQCLNALLEHLWSDHQPEQICCLPAGSERPLLTLQSSPGTVSQLELSRQKEQDAE